MEKSQKWLQNSKVKYLTYRQSYQKQKSGDDTIEMTVDETSNKYDEYLRTLSHGDLICQIPSLRDFVFQSFGIIVSIAEKVLSDLQTNRFNFACKQHGQQVKSSLFEQQ